MALLALFAANSSVQWLASCTHSHSGWTAAKQRCMFRWIWYKMYSCWYALCRILYWTDVNRNDPSIYRSSVINPARETLVSGNLVWPTALAVDFTGKQAANTCYYNVYDIQNWCEYFSPGLIKLDGMNAACAFRAALQCDLVIFFNCIWYQKNVAKILGLLGSEKASRHFSRFR